MDTFRLILQAEPGNIVAHHNLGTVLVAVGQADVAVQHLKVAFAGSPGNQVVWENYINALLTAKRAGEAYSTLDEGLQKWRFSGPNVLVYLARCLAGRQAATADRRMPIPLADVPDADFYRILVQAWPYSMSSTFGFVDSFHALYQGIGYVVARGIPGAFVECGTYLGGMSLLAALTFLKHGDTSRDLYLFDTFEGMPPPTAEDGPMMASAYDTNTQAGRTWAKADVESVRALMTSSGYPPEKIHLVKGMVEATIPVQAPERIAILRLDTDYYGSTKHELVHLYPRLSQGGYVIFDDYGLFPGAQKAVDEYFATDAEPILLNRINFTLRAGLKM